MYFQQGDTLIKQVKEIPLRAKKLAGNLIHKGQNHHHTIKGKFALYAKGNDFFIDAKGPCELLHEEHKTIKLPKGKYQKGIVLEYDHFLEESRQVID